MSGYLPILIMIAFAFVFGTVMTLVGRWLSKTRPTPEKALPYECGFDAIEDARSTFNIRYYLIAILFLL
ncbi:MAG: NADH-quinone oxidoreductase subunit A, partial [Burkholderiales bacterium]|nr:NADH-quinone oxidoreductase subunit A [Burkholderiales bacterium]